MVLVIYFRCSFYFMEAKALTNTKTMVLNMEFGVLDTYTTRRFSHLAKVEH